MRSHPKPEELEELVRGTLGRDQARQVVRHLLRGCETCQAALAPRAKVRLATDGVQTANPESAAAYERAIDNAFTTARRHGRHLKRESAKVGEALDRLTKDGVEGFQDFPMRLWGLAGYEALLERSWALRHEDPEQMVDLAQLATWAATRLSVARYGERGVKDFECRATIELANAYRVANRLEEAQSTIDRAAELLLKGHEDRLLKARLLEIRGNIFGDRRQFEAAFEAFDSACSLYKSDGAEHLAARTLVTQGLYVGYANDLERAISLLAEGLSSCDSKQDPELIRAAVHNIVWFSIEAGRLREARRMLWQHRHLYEQAGRQEMLRLRWLEGQIHAGFNELDRAERAFTEVRQGLLETGVPYTAAIVALDLASVWMCQGKEEQARTTVLEATQVFLDRRIGRETMATVLLLRTTFEFRMATSSLLTQVAQFMRHAEFPPKRADITSH